ncbi:uncharacterized protein [Mytilus edulis]
MTREMCCGLYLQKWELRLFDFIVSNVNKMNTCENSMSDSFMDEHAAKRIKLEIAERPLNFAISPEELEMQSIKKAKLPRDPMSHRIIEKRRRDRMNNCLAELSRLIPPSYLKQGQGRIEKTEIIEMASKLIRNLLNLHNFREMMSKELPPDGGGSNPCCQEKFYMGYKECQEEMLHQLIDTEGLDPKDAFYQRMTNFLDQSSKKFLRISTVKSASDVQDVKPDDSLTSEAAISNFNSQSNGQVLQGMGISENNMAMIKQDEHLCTLLKPTEQTSSQTSGYCSSSNQSLSDGSLSCITLQSVQRDTAEKDECNGSRGSSCSSDQNSSEGSNGHKVDYHKSHAYKFKHNITKRFSQERHPYHHKSDRSSDSMEDENEQGKQKSMGCRTSSSGTEYSRYLGSENSSTNSYCEKNKVPRYQNDFGSDGRFDSKQVPLPAFVLHPLGTHYVPVTIHPTHFKNVFKDETNTTASSAYHPISIPVNFCGPTVSIHTQVEQQLLHASEGQKEVKMH